MTVDYLILINQQKNHEGGLLGYRRGYLPGDELELGWSGHLGTITNGLSVICEHLFDMFNMFPPNGYRNRSLSVGDVVVVRRKGFWGKTTLAFAVDHVGFKSISIPEEFLEVL